MQRNTPEKNKCIKAGVGDGGDFRVYRAIKLQTFGIGSKWTVPFLGVNAKTLFWGQYPAVKRFRCSITLRAIYFCRARLFNNIESVVKMIKDLVKGILKKKVYICNVNSLVGQGLTDILEWRRIGALSAVA